MQHLRGLLVTLIVGLACNAARAAQVDFARLADEYLARHKVEGKAPGEFGMQELLEAHTIGARIGALELRFPREFLGDKSSVDDFKDGLSAALQVHQLWIDWMGASGPETERAKVDLADALKFMKTARVAGGAEREQDFLAALSGSGPLRPTFERLAESFRSGKALGIEPRGYKQQVLLIAPNREHFFALAAVLGKLEESSRSMYWNQGLVGWTEFGWNEVQVMTTQYPPLKPTPENLGEGVAMDGREPTGLMENVAQRVGIALCWHCFASALDPAFEMAVAQTLVVDLYGQNNTRSGGSGRSNEVAAMEAFIPGGNPNGGALPPGNADSPWRSTAGKDYFVRSLRDGLKVGAKTGAKTKEEKQAFFQLQSDDTSKKTPVRAPFLGSAAQGKELPALIFIGDYLEFFRSYKICFVHWLREESQPKKAEAHRQFAELLRRVAEAGGAATFEELVAEVYGTPYSATDLTSGCLEQRFLAWLSSK